MNKLTVKNLAIPLSLVVLFLLVQLLYHGAFRWAGKGLNVNLVDNAIWSACIVSALAFVVFLALFLLRDTELYKETCHVLYREHNRWSWAAVAVTVTLFLVSFLVLDLHSLNEIFPVSSFILSMYYPSAMVVICHAILNLFLLLFFFRIDAADRILSQITGWDALPIAAFILGSFIPMTVAIWPEAERLILIISGFSIAIAGLFIWASISRLHVPEDDAQKV